MDIETARELINYLYQENCRLEMEVIDLTFASGMEVQAATQKRNERLKQLLKIQTKQTSDLLDWASQNLNYDQYFSMLTHVEKNRALF